ncbi:uncharacterized protein B0J16DRAFT_405610 [Fusarium flagelliforme]|uniref:uncharacterized protein n=1 Tax=Fusarium flagelliforme TaxID=2675880 RepID=UPI001E8E4F6F|nr:uncharacterized protein B0J16DRAFT_405610 [Fusarium flagelliforme]KAH7173247.1 hypothetical protein B0J16DRAFT_405610 [Fusarium flagelliforme]
MATEEEARRIIEEIAGEYGYLDKEMMDNIGQFNADYRRKIDENWLKMENAASHSIKVLAKNIYGSGARFVFELLQNAEDNKFTKANLLNAPPFISFKIHPKQIVVECNEDGFTRPDLKAICSVGDSTKSALHGYIGAKGIGFKSVFIAASRVHIQSGKFSFEFRHKKTDPGLGMVRPIWVTPDDQIPSPLTRTILYLHDQDDEDDVEHLKAIISMQFDDLQETCLLFLRKLQQISVAFYDDEGNLERSKQFRKQQIDDHRVSLETITVASGKEIIKRQIYHIAKQYATGLAPSDNREPPKNEEERRMSTTADVVLAFPLTSDYEPQISRKKQELFAFLPLRTSDYKSRHKNTLRSITDVVISASSVRDQNGDPLFDDPIKDPFLSPKYSKAASDALKQYGLLVQNHSLLISLLKTDLESSNSKMRGESMPEEWHSCAAQVLSRYAGNTCSCCKEMKSLKILPLRDGSWTSCEEGPIYLPATGDIKIPAILDLRILDSVAIQNPDRRALFEKLGVSEATTAQVRQSINTVFGTWKSLRDQTIVAFLSYLYLTHQTGVHKREHYEKVQVSVRGNILKRPNSTTVYLPGTNHPCSPESLLTGQGDAPGFTVLFLKDYILDRTPTQSSMRSWKTWLVDYVGIHEQLSILSLSGDALSEPFLWVFNHRPESFLGLFEHLWLTEGKKLLKSQTLVSKVQDLSAKQLCKVDFSPKIKHTWLPFPKLQELVQRYMAHPDQFPFLRIEGDDTGLDPGAKWNFLTKHFSVGKDDDIEFLLEILNCIERSCPEPSSIRQSQRVLGLYVAIYAKLSVAKDHVAMAFRIKEFFNDSGILDPDEKAPMWTSSSFCLWSAPPDMVTAHSLKSSYARRSLSEEDMSNIENLFHRTLGIRNATVDNLVTELDELREEGCEEDDRILELYKYLHGNAVESSDIRLAFQESPLIFVRQQGVPGWYRTSECLWSSATPIRGKATLDDTYDELADFFIHELGVKSLTLQMVYDELRQSPNDSPEEMKVAIRSLNNFLQTEPAYLDPEPIRKAKVFPVKYPNGTVALGSIDVDFAIGDREKLKAAFENRISLLDFDLEDVRSLKPLFDWLRLQDRYLSSCVEEYTSLDGDTGSSILSGKRFLRTKAYYITRVAATFSSPRFRHNPLDCYEALRTMDVREVDEISSVLKMNQNGQVFESKVAIASEHIAETGGRLTVYVPREPKKQDICFGSVLPRKLAAWLMRHPTTHVTANVEVDSIFALTSIFASDKSVLGEILEDQGIIQISFDNDDEDESLPVEENEEDADTDLPPDRVLGTPQSSRQEFTPTNSSDIDSLSDTEHSTDLSETVVETVGQRSHMSQQRRPAVERYSPEPATSSSPSRNYINSSPRVRRSLSPGPETVERRLQEDIGYRSILERVVQAARRANFPHPGAFDMQDLRDALPDTNRGTYQSFDGLDVTDRVGSSNQQERDKRVGAAGELYVFELLSKLELPGWSRENWQSTIRTYATVHPDYTGLTHWSRRETADLVYVDSSGRLTSTLIEAGVLTDDGWSGKQPTYYFEVKTTTGPCKTPFYMSGNQYRLMERIHHNQDRSAIYMIFRIYSLLDSGRINHCAYMDPKKLRDEGRLVFSEGTWSVKPGSVGQQQ